MTLDELFLQEHTDKASNCHHYSKYYEIFFEPLRHAHISLLEVGIDSGFSLRAWRKYFENAAISGIDIRGNYEYLINEGCSATYILDQSDRNQLLEFSKIHSNEYDVIIDDCSHNSRDQIQTFEIFFEESLRPGGFYCIEDTLCGYDPRWNQEARVHDRIRQLVGEVSYNGKMSFDCLCSNKIGEVHKYINNLTHFEAHVEWVFHSCGLTIIKKM